MPTLTLPNPAHAFAASNQIDDRAGVIKGVSVITVGEAIGHGVHIDGVTLDTVLAASKAHANGVPVKMEHGTGLAEIVGTLHNFRMDGVQLRADLRLLMSHPHYATLMELAKKAPMATGLSISFMYRPETIGEKEFVRVTKLFSVDWVDLPAANPSGLFSRRQMSDADLEKLATHVFGADKVSAWKRNTGTQTSLSSVIQRNIHFSNLTVPGLDLSPIEKQFGAAKPLFGFARMAHRELQGRVDSYFQKAN